MRTIATLGIRMAAQLASFGEPQSAAGPVEWRRSVLPSFGCLEHPHGLRLVPNVVAGLVTSELLQQLGTLRLRLRLFSFCLHSDDTHA
jgi:hypothetical protein